jgi:hypothetical protein
VQTNESVSQHYVGSGACADNDAFIVNVVQDQSSTSSKINGVSKRTSK